ncbi:MAG: hypothetical protein N3A69_07885 [Leptospiraceae bacterium]|nr:hypothetical protein [Leptospiraceae bacterium]
MSVDITARTIKEAEERARSLGVEAHYGDEKNLKLANYINQGLRYAQDRGRKLPEHILFDSELAEEIFKNRAIDVPAAFLEPSKSPYNKTTILVNEKNDFWKGVKEIIVQYFKDKYITTDSEHHVILHEIVHLEHFLKDEKLYKKKVKFTDEELKNKINKEVCELASLNSWKFVAEIKVGLIHGKKYPEDIMKIYYELGGD